VRAEAAHRIAACLGQAADNVDSERALDERVQGSMHVPMLDARRLA
jgi:hypothetical protein